MARLTSALVAALLLMTSASLSTIALAEEAQAIRNVPRISIDELKALMEKNAVLVIDVRDADAFAKGHIPGAKALVGGWDEWVLRGEKIQR